MTSLKGTDCLLIFFPLIIKFVSKLIRSKPHEVIKVGCIDNVSIITHQTLHKVDEHSQEPTLAFKECNVFVAHISACLLQAFLHGFAFLNQRTDCSEVLIVFKLSFEVVTSLNFQQAAQSEERAHDVGSLLFWLYLPEKESRINHNFGKSACAYSLWDVFTEEQLCHLDQHLLPNILYGVSSCKDLLYQ